MYYHQCPSYTGGGGALCMRRFADVDSKTRLEGVKALLRAEYMVLQVVVFPKDDIIHETDTEELYARP
ncbi:hypothetical protein DRJ17_06455 [Candidatus Woesearchaeota archaeon]|nr:MAG: hypothetical protein DRJ17_06455 [Candidatus Woesearchaeota archaeon]